MLCAVGVRADSTSFDDANRLYEQGKYLEAVRAYSDLISAGTNSAALWFNLGNAQYKAGRLGEAIYCYQQSERLTPRDSDVRANLDFARRQVTGPTLHSSWLQSRLESLTTNEWTLVAAAPSWVCIGLLIALQFRPAWKQALRRWIWTAGVAGVGACGLLAVVLHHRLHERTVVVNQRDAVVRAGPFEESPGAFTASDGAEFALLDAKGGWFQVSDGSKALGWVNTNSVVTLH